MAEQLRDYYLSTLGLVQYVPRDYCRPESAAELNADAVPRSPQQEAPVAEPAQPGVLAELKSSISQPPQPQEQAPSAKDRVSPPSEVDSDPQDVRFRIICWQPAADIFVVASLDYGQNPQAQQQELLAGILRAIGRLPQPLSEPELLDWPTKPGADSSASGAKTMFSTFLNARLQSSPVRWVMVMGDIPAQYVLFGAEAPVEPAKVGDRVAISDTATAILTPGLAEMMADRECKRITWDAIRFLAEQTD